jgi:hypothetical protein
MRLSTLSGRSIFVSKKQTMKLTKIKRSTKMNALTTGVRTPAAVLLYMLNFQKGSRFEVECDGEKLIEESGENGLTSFREGKHKEYAIKVSNSKDTVYFVEPFVVESFPDKEHVLSFHCRKAIVS